VSAGGDPTGGAIASTTTPPCPTQHTSAFSLAAGCTARPVVPLFEMADLMASPQRTMSASVSAASVYKRSDVFPHAKHQTKGQQT
jgi:hypothetical protein